MPSKKVRAKQKALIPKQEKLFKKVEKEKRQLIKEYVNACSKRKNITIEKILEEVKEIWNEEIHLEVQKDVVELVKQTKKSGKKVFAVGTTATRALETAFTYGDENGYAGYTKLFIYPGFKFKAVDRLITNFHLPQSSLLMLVSAFIGYDNMKHIYKTAVDKKYRFLSYGDAMLLKKNEI